MGGNYKASHLKKTTVQNHEFSRITYNVSAVVTDVCPGETGETGGKSETQASGLQPSSIWPVLLFAQVALIALHNYVG